MEMNNNQGGKCCHEGETCMMCRMHQSMCGGGKHGCGMCGGMNHHGILRIILGIGILAFVFWFGLKLGQFSCEVSHYGDYGYGGGMMQSRHGGYGNGGYGMMSQPDVYYYDQTSDGSVSAPAAPQTRAVRTTSSASKTQ